MMVLIRGISFGDVMVLTHSNSCGYSCVGQIEGLGWHIMLLIYGNIVWGQCVSNRLHVSMGIGVSGVVGGCVMTCKVSWNILMNRVMRMTMSWFFFKATSCIKHGTTSAAHVFIQQSIRILGGAGNRFDYFGWVVLFAVNTGNRFDYFGWVVLFAVNMGNRFDYRGWVVLFWCQYGQSIRLFWVGGANWCQYGQSI